MISVRPDEAHSKDNLDRIVCTCRKVTCRRLLEMFDEAPNANFQQLKALNGIADRCTSCEIEIRVLLSERRLNHSEPNGKLSLRQHLTIWRKRLNENAERRKRIKNSRRRTGLFVIRNQELESVLVLANVAFPEDRLNPNGKAVRFEAILYDASGKFIAASLHHLKDGESRSYHFEDLFPEKQLPDSFEGSLYIDFLELAELGSLRPYCLLVSKADGGATQSHYHDKYRGDEVPGYYHVSPVCVSGKTCWIMASNPFDAAYTTKAFLRVNEVEYTAEITIPPQGCLWKSVTRIFGEELNVHDLASVFWMENRQPIMLWFAWKQTQANSWAVQHH